MGCRATLTLATSRLNSLICNGIMVPASEWKQELNEVKQSTQDTSNPKYMQANALFNLCNQNFLKSPRTRFFFKKKNQDVQRSLGDYEAMETILRADALKQSSLVGSDLLPVSQSLLRY